MATFGPAAQGADQAPQLTPRPLVIVGGGEHARVVADAARTRPDRWHLIGFTDPAPAVDAAERLGIDHLGEDEVAHEGTWLVLGVGTLDVRRRLVEMLEPVGGWATVVHAASWVSPAAELAEGAVVLAGAVVNAGASIGPHAIVNSGAIVEHDVRVGTFAHLAPGVVIGGGARVGAGAFVGLGARVRDHVDVGDDSVVGMGSAVVDDVAAGATVTGTPARVREAP